MQITRIEHESVGKVGVRSADADGRGGEFEENQEMRYGSVDNNSQVLFVKQAYIHYNKTLYYFFTD